MHNTINTLNTLAPVFLIIALGAWLRKINFFSSDFAKGLSKLTYWVALPTMLFYELATATTDYSIIHKPFLVVLAGMAGCIIIAYLTAYLLHLDSAAIGTFVQGAFRGNLAYIGLPIAVYSFKYLPSPQAAKMGLVAVFILGLTTAIFNTIAVIVLLAARHRLDRYVPIKIISKIFTNPLIISCVIGVLYAHLFNSMPVALDRTLNAVSKIALPLALITIGSTLIEPHETGRPLVALASSFIKTFAGPIVGLIMIKMLHLAAPEARIALIYLACPTAVASFVLAEQLDGDGRLAAKIVVFTSLLSVVSLGLVVAFF